MFDFIRKSTIWTAWNQGLDREIEVGAFELKSAQDLAVYSQLRHLKGHRILEVGAGNSRVLPALARSNSCAIVEKFDGSAGGPALASIPAGVTHFPVYLGDYDPKLPAGAFDVVFSISVVEHVPPSELAAFHDDQLRILKPGGLFLHAIDLYLEDQPSSHQVRMFESYRRWATSPGVVPIADIYEGPCQFTCDLASNPDNIMYRWGKSAPELTPLRKVAQSVSILVGGRKIDQAGEQS